MPTQIGHTPLLVFQRVTAAMAGALATVFPDNAYKYLSEVFWSGG